MTISVPVRLVPVADNIDVWVIRNQQDKEAHDFWWSEQRNKRAYLHARNPRPLGGIIYKASMRPLSYDPDFDYSGFYQEFKQEGSVFDDNGCFDPGY